jgi:hypothetical protein
MLGPPPAVWTLEGPTLVRVAGGRAARPGALYRDTVWGRFVVAVSRLRLARPDLRPGVAVDNPSPLPVRLEGWYARAGGAPSRPARLVLAPGGRLVWTAARAARALAAGGRAVFAAPWPLGGRPAPVVLTLFAARVPPDRPGALPLLPRAGAARATFAHADAVLRLVAPARGRLPLPWGAGAFPRELGVDSADGVWAWAGVAALSPRVRLVLPVQATAWCLLRRGDSGTAVATARALGAGRRRRFVDWRPGPADLAPAARLTLEAMSPAGGCGRRAPPPRGWAPPPRAAGRPPEA